MTSRKQRREEAKLNNEAFEPNYNGRTLTKAEYNKEVSDLKEERKKKFGAKEESTKE